MFRAKKTDEHIKVVEDARVPRCLEISGVGSAEAMVAEASILSRELSSN
jgi:hypothetical protein